jgi:nicotinate-nucleotide pyrophosphorylase (carboxylating)
VSDEALRELVARALAEDVGAGDATAEAVVPDDARGRARIVQKAPGVLFGLDAAEETFGQAGAESFDRIVVEGQWRDEVPVQVALVTGPARALLAGERTALNLLGHLSGVATLAARFAAAVEGTGAQVLDTRKTTPGLRALEKAAVRAGGGRNHRMGLYDAILIKENHAALAGGVGEAVRRAREARPDLEVEVECRDLDEVRETLGAGATRLLLDNMDLAQLRAAVAARDDAAELVVGGDQAAGGNRRASLEASGGIALDNVREVAETGVDFVSVGALTHSAPALDVSMLLDPA